MGQKDSEYALAAGAADPGSGLFDKLPVDPEPGLALFAGNYHKNHSRKPSASAEGGIGFRAVWPPAVLVPVVKLQNPAVPVVNGNFSVGSPKVKTPRGPDGSPADMRSRKLAFRNGRLDQIARLKAMYLFVHRQKGPGKAMSSRERPLVSPPASAFDGQNRAVPVLSPGNAPHAKGIQGVPLGNAKARPVELGLPACAHGYGKAQQLLAAPKSPSRGVCGGGVLEGGFGFGQNFTKNFRFFRQKLAGVLGALLLAALWAGQSQVGHSVRAASGLGNDVVDLEGGAVGPAVGAAAPPFFQQVLPDLKAEKLTPLVQGPADFRVLKLLRVKPDRLHRQGGYGGEFLELFDEIDSGVDPVLNGGGEVAFLYAAAVQKPWLAVPEVGGAPPAAVILALGQLGADLLAAVGELKKPNGLGCRLARAASGLDLPGQSQPRRFAARIDLKGQRLQARILDRPVAYDDGEWL